jgi:hypothetical protein
MLDQLTDVGLIRAIVGLVIGNRPGHRWQVPICLVCAQAQRKATLSSEAPTTSDPYSMARRARPSVAGKNLRRRAVEVESGMLAPTSRMKAAKVCRHNASSSDSSICSGRIRLQHQGPVLQLFRENSRIRKIDLQFGRCRMVRRTTSDRLCIVVSSRHGSSSRSSRRIT